MDDTPFGPVSNDRALKLGINVAQNRAGRCRAGRSSFAITGRRLHPLICLSSRRLPFGGSSYVSFLAINGGSLGFAVTEHPMAEWLARQITEAFPWDTAPKYLIRDNDRAFGGAYTARVRLGYRSCRLTPTLMRGGSKPLMRRTADQMPLNIECVVDRRMNRNEALSRFG
jgi:hypothetical protein